MRLRTDGVGSSWLGRKLFKDFSINKHGTFHGIVYKMWSCLLIKHSDLDGIIFKWSEYLILFFIILFSICSRVVNTKKSHERNGNCFLGIRKVPVLKRRKVPCICKKHAEICSNISRFIWKYFMCIKKSFRTTTYLTYLIWSIPKVCAISIEII
jgi:hypothetical protein